MDGLGEPMKICGYAGRLSVPAGQDVAFHLSSEHPRLRTEIVRLRRGGGPRHHTALIEEPVPAGIVEAVPGRVQATQSGSYLHARLDAEHPAIGMALWLRPTTGGTEARPVLTAGPVALTAASDGIRAEIGGRTAARLDAALAPGRWHLVSLAVDSLGRVELAATAADAQTRTAEGRTSPCTVAGPLLIGAGGDRAGADAPARPTFNGAVARPVVTADWDRRLHAHLLAGRDPLELADPARTSALDLAAGPAGAAVPDRGSLTSGATVHHLPARGVPGPFWRGAERDFRAAPAEFDAVHLHDDDLSDAGWSPDLVWSVPEGLDSGVYALKVSAGGDTDRIPVVVTPHRHTAPVLVVLPTWTYLAYANWRTYAEFETERLALYGEDRGIDERDRWLTRHPEFGKSLYDVHGDGSGVVHSSALRPIVNLRPDYYTPTTRGFRHFAQDLLLLHWLDSRGERYAVATDDEVDREGAGLLSRYRVVLTGSHPEYCSAAMLDAYSAYTRSGGRLMYLGGNGFYQVTSRSPACPSAVEIRRGHAGVATWVSDPGEEHLAATGEPGGLWRMRGRAPNRLVGVGFTAQGFDKGHGYRRSARSGDPDVAWVFAGVDAGAGEVFGATGPGLGGAAADEFDRADTGLGTPAGAAVLASSVGHSERIALAPEEVDHGYAAPPPGVHPNVRSDVVLFGRPGGGAVFAVGSIGWTTAMSHAGGDNAVARVTGNVLDRFRTADGSIAP